MIARSLIYRHILIYRFVMEILYLGGYKSRFYPVMEHIRNLPANSLVIELCFGDVYLAEYCKKKGYRWMGIDLNEQFVKYAQKAGYEAYLNDLASYESLPPGDLCIMMGSLYHFHPDTPQMLSKMIKACNTVILSEPILNLSSKKGLIGFLARRAANAGKGKEKFRYNKETFTSLILAHSEVMNYRIAAMEDHGKDMIVKLVKNGTY